MNTNASLADLSERQLLERFDDLVRRDRANTAQLLVHIAEIDARKLWAKHACSSMFAFCMERFHMSESVTAKRIWAARTARRFPVILQMVAKGELHLSGINRLSKYLTESNHRSLLCRAKHKSSREIDVLVAELAPRPDVPSRIRALPRRTARCRDGRGSSFRPRSFRRAREGRVRPSARVKRRGAMPWATSPRPSFPTRAGTNRSSRYDQYIAAGGGCGPLGRALTGVAVPAAAQHGEQPARGSAAQRAQRGGDGIGRGRVVDDGD
jgi:hypothetical protein